MLVYRACGRGVYWKGGRGWRGSCGRVRLASGVGCAFRRSFGNGSFPTTAVVLQRLFPIAGFKRFLFPTIDMAWVFTAAGLYLDVSIHSDSRFFFLQRFDVCMYNGRHPTVLDDMFGPALSNGRPVCNFVHFRRCLLSFFPRVRFVTLISDSRYVTDSIQQREVSETWLIPTTMCFSTALKL